MNKALIRYLEYKLVKGARECGRYKVLTKNTYSKTVMKEAEKAAMAEFMDNVKLIIATMSYNVFVPVPRVEVKIQYLFCVNKGSGAKARGFISAGGLTVMKGSVVSNDVAESLLNGRRANYYTLRQRLESEGVIVNRVFKRNYEFSAPSAASTVILGYASNGNIDWKT